ncbi:hypothetical protein HMPREF1246_0807 [Acidaminococcus sp. BV3L6]|nr:hypothetical protein HMPREF1246_0807 [Acidaminococcus sp. BV3L6]DAS26510.1 MAG TPA: Replication protein [Caudoviricetes sp.]
MMGTDLNEALDFLRYFVLVCPSCAFRKRMIMEEQVSLILQ